MCIVRLCRNKSANYSCTSKLDSNCMVNLWNGKYTMHCTILCSTQILTILYTSKKITTCDPNLSAHSLYQTLCGSPNVHYSGASLCNCFIFQINFVQKNINPLLSKGIWIYNWLLPRILEVPRYMIYFPTEQFGEENSTGTNTHEPLGKCMLETESHETSCFKFKKKENNEAYDWELVRACNGLSASHHKSTTSPSHLSR